MIPSNQIQSAKERMASLQLCEAPAKDVIARYF